MEESMKNTIKWLSLVSLLLIVVMSFALISCGGGDDTNDTDNTDGSSYTVTFKHADGTEDKVSVSAGASATAPAAKQEDGYTVAWENVDLSNVTSNMTVNAVKTPIEYTIKYELNEGTNSEDNVATYTIESTTIVLSNASKTGYKFIGWYSDAEFTTKVEEIAARSKGNKTLYAKYEAIPYTITYETNGGTNTPSNPTSYDITSADIILKGASLEGYDFVGWYYDMAYTKPCDKIPAGSTGDIKLYAQYDLERYEINYQLDGGKNAKNNPKDFNKDESVALEDPSKNGYTFKGWYKDRNFSEEFTGINKGTTGIVTVYAKWEIITYNMEYVILGGVAEVNPDNPTTYTIETVQDLLPPLNIKPGYTFEGWFTDSSFKTQLDKFEKTLEERKLFAKITANEYNIEYDAKGGSISDENPIKYTVENVGDKKLVVVDSARAGYKFLGWYLTEDYSGDVVTEIPASTLTDIKLFAKWEIETYNITYVLNGGVNAETNVGSYTVENHISFAVPTIEADTYFIDWYEDAEFTKVITKTNGKTGDITVYARWWDKTKDPSKKLDTSTGITVEANSDNSRKDQAVNIFDGNKSSVGIYSAGNDWYGVNGDYITITFDEAISILTIKGFGAGNYTTSKVTAYDEEGNEVASGSFLFNGGAYDNLSSTINFKEAVVVKTLRIEITGLKWNDPKTHKIAEVEIYVSNPDYVAPEVVE